MRVSVYDGDRELFHYDAGDEDNTAYPADLKERAKVLKVLTAGLKFLLFKKRGALDNEVGD
jgi:hypothetical protein